MRSWRPYGYCEFLWSCRKNQSESWKSRGNLFLKKGMNPVIIISGFFSFFFPFLSYMSSGIELSTVQISKPECHVIHDCFAYLQVIFQISWRA